MNIIPTHFFVFDVESIGLHGEAFAVAGGVLEVGRLEVGRPGLSDAFCFSIDPDEAGGSASDRQWVETNTPPILLTHNNPAGMRLDFWSHWKRALEKYKPAGGIAMAVECGWPVEARFLAECIDDMPALRKSAGPYPLHEIASFMAAAGMDPMATYDRQTGEELKHHPLHDARQSARLLDQALGKLRINAGAFSKLEGDIFTS